MRAVTQGSRRAPTSARVRAAVLAVACAVHLLVLYVPRAPSVSSSGVRLDLLVHLAVFAAVALTAVWAGLSVRLVAGVLAVEAVVSEVVQGLWLPHRSGDVTDAAADLLGAALGLWLGVRLLSRSAGPRRADAGARP